jgi:tetratricopeptide (TPR) repeat protein
VSAKKANTDKESEVWSAIAAFEQILEAMPNDRTSIEALAHAYEQIGDLTSAKDYLIRLANIVVEEANPEAAQTVMEKLLSYSTDDPVVEDAVARLKQLVENAPAPPTIEANSSNESAGATTSNEAGSGGTTSFNLANELAFAWNLLQSNELTQEEYSNVVQDLTDMSGRDSAITVSVLHVLQDRGFKNLNRILASVAKDCGTPIISLSGFEPQQEAICLLPTDFMVRRGVIIFDLFGNEALAVIMNPYDKELATEVETLSGRKCHFNLTPPREFDEALQKITDEAAE